MKINNKLVEESNDYYKNNIFQQFKILIIISLGNESERCYKKYRALFEKFEFLSIIKILKKGFSPTIEYHRKTK